MSAVSRPATLKTLIPFRVRPMLATLVREPFDREGWVYEEKYDGYRILAYKEGKDVRLLSRNDIDRTKHFHGIAAAIRALRPSTLLLDGEVVVFDKRGISRFQLLQRKSIEHVYAVFDCLYVNGKDLRREPLSARRTAMEQSIRSSKVIMPSRRLSANGLEAYQVATKKGYEGVIGKDLSSRYEEVRSNSWLKVKVHQEDEFIIAGFTDPSGSRNKFGALLLAAYQEGKLNYVGKVGTGFNEKTLASLHRKFLPLIRKKSELSNPPRGKGVTYLAPRLVAQISYQEWTAEKKLRQPVFLELREDKHPREVRMPEV